jgi:hypothetical protein
MIAENNGVMSPVQARSAGGKCGALIVLLLSISLAGCGDSGPTPIVVKGKVTLDGKPATEGGVTYHDAATGLQQYGGGIASDGTYSIRSRKMEGLPAGLYRVTVLVTETQKNVSGDTVALPQSVSNQKFFNPTTTPFEVDVKADAPPGAYDLAVTR